MPVLTEFFGVLSALLGRYQNMFLSRLMRDTLHWLPAALQRISYRVAVLVWRCLLGSAPAYLWELCSPVSGVSGRRDLHSSVSGQLLVPRAAVSTRQRRAFSTWNGLPMEVRLLPKNSEDVFCKLPKRLTSFAVPGLDAPLGRFLEGAPYG